MAVQKSCFLFSFVAATLLFISGCSPDSKTTWHTVKEGTFDSSHVFYEQFGAAPYQLSTSFPLPMSDNIQTGTILRYAIYDTGKKNIIFTAFMEKTSLPENASTGGWVYRATDAKGEKINVGDSCSACHQKQANNDYLFSLPVNKNPPPALK